MPLSTRRAQSVLPSSILLIEDNPGDARLIQVLLSRLGPARFNFVSADTLRSGIERLRAADVDVVLLDLMLPDSSGFETFRSVHAAAPTVPIVVLSGLDNEDLALEAVHEGAQDYLVKGQLDAALLRRVLRYAIERGRLLAAEQAARAQAETARQRAALLDAAGELLAQSLDYEATLRHVAGLMVHSFARYCAIDLVEPDGSLRRVVVVSAKPSEQARVQPLLKYPPKPASPHPAWTVLATGRAEVLFEIPDTLLVATAHDPEHLALLRTLDLGLAVLVPMKAHGRLLGTILLMWPSTFSDWRTDLVDLAQALADRAALAVDNARLHHDLEEALRAREAFFAAITHDLRNPLSSMTLWIDTLALASEGLASRAQNAAVLNRAVERLQDLVSRSITLVDEVMDIARLDAGRPVALARSDTDLFELCRAAMEARQGQSDHDFRLEAEESGLRGDWDANRLRRVLENLLDNAIKYSPGAPPIAVRLSREDSDGQRWAKIQVEDHGVGIPAADLPGIFERFHRGRNVAQRPGGAGLGLWGSRLIVEQHGGTLSVTSQEAEGSTFTVRLPISY